MSKSHDQPEILGGQPCPMCKNKSLTLMERDEEVQYFGKIFVFSMTCENCKYHMADVEIDAKQEPSKSVFEISSEEDMKVRLVKSSQATVKLPHITTIFPGPASIGYVSNVEGLLNRVKHVIEQQRDNSEDPEDKKKAKNLLKKITKIMWGQEKLKIIIEDPSGNSAIVSDKTVKSKL